MNIQRGALSQIRWTTHLGLILACILMCFPALIALQIATLTIEQAFIIPPQLFPPGRDFGANIQTLFQDRNFDTLIYNTLVITVFVVIAKTVLALIAGLAFVYFQFRGKWILFFIILLTLLMPTEVILFPLFRLVARLEWIQTSPKLALTMPFLATAIGVFLFRQHFSNIPTELVDASQIDGASPIRFLMSVLIPMSWNVIIAHAMLQFISMWNQYLWPKLILTDPNSALNEQVIQIGVQRAVLAGSGQTDFGLLMTAGIIAALPPIIVFVMLQKQFMSGFSITRDR